MPMTFPLSSLSLILLDLVPHMLSLCVWVRNRRRITHRDASWYQNSIPWPRPEQKLLSYDSTRCNAYVLNRYTECEDYYGFNTRDFASSFEANGGNVHKLPTVTNYPLYSMHA